MKIWTLGGCGLLALSSMACGAADGIGDTEGAADGVGEAETVGTTQEALIDSEYALGVIPIKASDCAPGNTVSLYTDDEDDNNESDSTGWDTPDTARRARLHGTNRTGSRFTFCRVDGRAFKSLTAHGNVQYYYAALKLGSTCPNGAKTVKRNVDGEHDDNQSAITGPVGPNTIGSSIAHLQFCLFDTNSDKMYSFPSVGFQYAVFHDYDGPQPAHFVGKRWVYTDDEDRHNLTLTTAAASYAVDEFEPIVGGADNTMFDMAWVQ